MLSAQLPTVSTTPKTIPVSLRSFVVGTRPRKSVIAAAVIERTGLDIGVSPGAPSTDTGSGSDYDKRGTGGGGYRLLLIDSEKHTKDRVVTAICTVVPGVDPIQAENCYYTAQQIGIALITIGMKEHCEFYCQQLFRLGCKASMEPDTTTL